MTVGRCAGCGVTDASCSKIRKHVMSCPDYIKLFKTDKSKCLDPEDEYIRFNSEENSQESRQEAKTDRLTKRFAEMDVQRLNQVDRWQPRDLLAD